jgi:hypothetical protein
VRSGNSLNIRLPDGRTMSLPVSDSMGSPTSEVCCFCGETVENSSPEHVRLDARWEKDGAEREQSWEAHHGCLLERLHERVKGQGPFVGDS